MESERYGTATEGINVPLRISSINSSPPTTSAPAALASSAAGPSANTATLTVLKNKQKNSVQNTHDRLRSIQKVYHHTLPVP